MAKIPNDVAGVGADDLEIPPELDRRRPSKRIPLPEKTFPINNRRPANLRAKEAVSRLADKYVGKDGGAPVSQPEATSLNLPALAGEILDPKTPEQWSGAITASWRDAAAGIIRTSALLNQARATLDHGQWQHLKLPFSTRTAQMLMEITRNPALVKTQNFSHLPPHWTTLHEIAQRPPEEIDADIASGAIHPGLKRYVNNDVWLEKHRKFSRLKKIRPASPPKKPPKPAPQASPRPQPLPPTAANELLAAFKGLAADLEAWPPNIVAAVRFMLPEERRELGELADRVAQFALRVYDASIPKKRVDI